MIAALFVDANGIYRDVAACELWDVDRDARNYKGPWPVVAHPPCSRWCQLAGLVEKRWGHKRGDDGGCFAAALAAVRTYGGVLEHPAYSEAWATFNLPTPSRSGGWQRGLFCGGYSCYVEQARYGHAARKATWLYAYGVDLPAMRWGWAPDHAGGALVSWCGNKVDVGRERRRLGKKEASATPIEFRDALIAIALTARRDHGAP